MDKIAKFIKKYECTSDKYTHHILETKYCIPNDKYKDFMKIYTDLIIKNYQINASEKYRKYGPIYIHITSIKNIDIKKIIIAFNKIIKKYLDVKFNDLITYVLKNNDVINIIYPYLCVQSSLHNTMINVLIKENNIGQQDKIDGSEIPMYGSINCGQIMYIYHTANNKIFNTLLSHDKTKKELVKYLIEILSVRRFTSESNITSSLNKIDSSENDGSENDTQIETEHKNLTGFLMRCRTQKGEIFTHTSMSGGSWNIPDDILDVFYLLYSKEVTARELCMTEKHNPVFGPIVIDFDFKFNEVINPRPVDAKLMKKIIQKIRVKQRFTLI